MAEVGFAFFCDGGEIEVEVAIFRVEDLKVAADGSAG